MPRRAVGAIDPATGVPVPVKRVYKRKTVTPKRKYLSRRMYPSSSGRPVNIVQGVGGYSWAKGSSPSIGARMGAFIGDNAQSALARITGLGDYHVKHNALLETNGPPEVINNGKEFIVRHREYIQDIYSASGTANTPSPFAVSTYNINPGNIGCFPWLASIADKFEQYRVEGMLFEYKSLYSDAVVTQNGSIGSIILATEYNAGAPGFSSKQQMENYQFAQSAKPSCSILHPIECARSQSTLTELYVRTGTVPQGEDIKTYDFGDFQIASQGIPLGAAGAAVNLGELWITYQITLLKPRIPTGPGLYVDSGYAKLSVVPTAGLFSSVSVLPPTPYGVLSTSSNINMFFTPNTLNIPLIPSAINYYVTFVWWAPAQAPGATLWKAPGLPSFANCTRLITLNSEADTPNTGGTGASQSTSAVWQGFIACPASQPGITNATITFGTGFLCDTVNPVALYCILNAVPTNVN